MGFYTEHVVPRCTHYALSRPPILKLRERVAKGLSGELLEIGFGSGLNVPYYPAAVTKVYAVEPSPVGRKLAEKSLQASRIPIEWSGLDGQRLELGTASVDTALTTFTLCTIPDVALALRELRRVIRPGGMLHFLEHGRSPDAKVAKWQDRLTPLQKRFAAGCHLNRPTADLVRDAGFCLDTVDNYYLPGPRFMTYISEGKARRC